MANINNVNDWWEGPSIAKQNGSNESIRPRISGCRPL